MTWGGWWSKRRITKPIAVDAAPEHFVVRDREEGDGWRGGTHARTHARRNSKTMKAIAGERRGERWRMGDWNLRMSGERERVRQMRADEMSLI